jgi:hypothetical protein
MFKVGDEVHNLRETRVGTITNIVDNIAIIEYPPHGTKEKMPLKYLVKNEAEKRVSVEQFDEAVKALMYSIAEDVGDTAQLDGVLEIVGGVCGRLKARLFEGND